jgi:hypothetical protein
MDMNSFRPAGSERPGLPNDAVRELAEAVRGLQREPESATKKAGTFSARRL